jgi:hypothetical protein
MKTVSKLVVASVLAISAIAPALADESTTLAERNTYFYTPDARPNVQHQTNGLNAFAAAPRFHSGSRAWAHEPVYQPAGRDLGEGSQS